MSISTISIRVDSELKRKAQQVFKKMGLNMTSAIYLKNKLTRCVS